MWTIVFTSVQISSRHQTLYRVLCLSQSLNGRSYFPPPSVIFSQDNIAWKFLKINLSLKTIKDPAASNGVSNLQRCRAAGYLTLAAVAKC